MECNRDDAVRSKDIAETKFMENDIAGAKKFALKAKALFEPLEGIDQMIVALDVHVRAQTKIAGENDWYGILEVPPMADEEAIKKKYKKLAFQTHPDKNSSVCAKAAFNLISDAWNVLSDNAKRMVHDHRRRMHALAVHQNNFKATARKTSNSSMSGVNRFCDRQRKVAPHLAHEATETFWTLCPSCLMNFQYSREYLNHQLKCLKCHAVFVATEVRPPTSGVQFCPSELMPMATNNNIGGNTVPGMVTPGVQAGVSQGNQNCDPTVLKSATCAQSTRHTVQQTCDSIRKEEAVGASIPANEEAHSREVLQHAARKHAHAVSSVRQANAATRKHEAAKRKRANAVKQGTWQSATSYPDGDGCKPVCPAKTKPRSTSETSGAKKREVSSGDFNSESSSNAGRTSFSRELMKLDVRSILIEKGKLQASEKQRKGAEYSSVDPKKDVLELVSKRVDSEEKEREKCSNQVGLEEKLKSWQRRVPEVRIVYTRRNRKQHKKELGYEVTGANPATKHHMPAKYGCLNQEPSHDEGSDKMPIPDADLYSVPDADFNSFGDHSESSFQNDQVWAMYDEEDGMPRYYTLIRKVISTRPFKVRLADLGASNWISYGYSKICGEFKVGVSRHIDQVNIFSHKVKCDKGPGGIIRIFPKKGDIWALYQNWSPDWDQYTPDDMIYKYELVEILDSYNPAKGISVMPIVKVPGFVSVFKPLHNATKRWRIPREEMMRFSHQVPFHVLTGEEAHNAPKGCYELDPGSTPQELLHVVPPSGGAK
ncbi:unnamed protein product [Miscanthus lutarioriparius]|uniref:J domain-containing protein n=1 Tax=Miscanthus lutarioriparius TaxID=422564 RepID=A0A811NTV1_9POAL|nr:unnamed protein product [Miscanthus lutarioriparius]